MKSKNFKIFLKIKCTQNIEFLEKLCAKKAIETIKVIYKAFFLRLKSHRKTVKSIF